MIDATCVCCAVLTVYVRLLLSFRAHRLQHMHTSTRFQIPSYLIVSPKTSGASAWPPAAGLLWLILHCNGQWSLMDHLREAGVCLTWLAAVHYSGYCYGNEWSSRELIVLITRAHAAERVTDYPAANKGQPQSLPVEIIQFADGFNAGVLCRRLHKTTQSHCERCNNSWGGGKRFCF